MSEQHFIVATAGHVDHGKSALVKILTGIDPDRLPEEKARGITIDLGFAQLDLTGPNEQRFQIGIIDVPGHEDFVRNMIAGVGSIDLAVLVVAADDGWMPQTEEHLQILTYLGVRRVVVALTKSDLGDAESITSQVREKLKHSPFSDSQIVPTSTRTGNGIDQLKAALVTALTGLKPPRDIGKPRLFVDRAFTLHGIGTVVTGTLTGGQLHRGQNVLVQPQNFAARIRSLQSHGRDLETARPGMRTAINLPDVQVGDGDGSIQRGDIITIADLKSTSDTLDVLLEKSARIENKSAAARSLKNGSSVYIHFGTTRLSAKIALADNRTLDCGEHVIAQLRLQSPTLASIGDRFIVRDSSASCTIAGGTVLEAHAGRKNLRDPEHGRILRARAEALADVDACVQTQLELHAFGERSSFLNDSNFSKDEIAAALSRLQQSGRVVVDGEMIANAEGWRRLRQRAVESIDRAHETHPEQRGMDLKHLQRDLDLAEDVRFNALISSLCERDFIRIGSAIARDTHRAVLPPEIGAAAKNIRDLLATKPLDPPGRKELGQDPRSQQALRFMIESGELVELGNDLIVLRESAKSMQGVVVDFISAHGPATASQIRQQIGTSRRLIIPFLEYLDRIGVTARAGDLRKLRAAKSAKTAPP